jgi:hypothetical protein
MAQDGDVSKAADKGKGKAVEGDRKPEDVEKDAAGQPASNGKKDDKADGLFASAAGNRLRPPLLTAVQTQKSSAKRTSSSRGSLKCSLSA